MRTQIIRAATVDDGSWRLPRVDPTGWLAEGPAVGGSPSPARRRRPRRTQEARAARERTLARRRRRRHGRTFVAEHQTGGQVPVDRTARATSVRRVTEPPAPVARVDRAAPDGGYRIGRWGRLALTTLTAAAVALIVGQLVIGAIGGSRGPEPVDVTVRPGDTLWSIASTAAPDRDPRTVIEDIRGLNDLPGDTVRVGEVLRVPASAGSGAHG